MSNVSVNSCQYQKALTEKSKIITVMTILLFSQKPVKAILEKPLSLIPSTTLEIQLHKTLISSKLGWHLSYKVSSEWKTQLEMSQQILTFSKCHLSCENLTHFWNWDLYSATYINNTGILTHFGTHAKTAFA